MIAETAVSPNRRNQIGMGRGEAIGHDLGLANRGFLRLPRPVYRKLGRGGGETSLFVISYVIRHRLAPTK